MANYIPQPQVGFLEATKIAFKKSFTFTGRSRRSEYWWAVLAIAVISILFSWVPVVGSLLTLYLSIVSYAMEFRRLHDTGRSGWWAGANLILGILGGIILLIGIFTAGISASELAEDAEESTKLIANALVGTGIAYTVIGLLCWAASGIIAIICFIFTLLDSTPEPNKYGESPKYVSENTEA